MAGPVEPEIRASLSERERLAKEWLLRVVERTPLPGVDALALNWITSDAPRLIGDIFTALAEPGGRAGLADGEWVEQLAAMRTQDSRPDELARDLAALHVLLIEALRHATAGRRGEFTPLVEHLAEIFAELQAAVDAKLLGRGAPGGEDALTGLPGPAALEEWVDALVAEHDRYGHPFALAVLDVDGLDRINDAYGRSAGDRVLSAIAALLRRRIRACDRAFRRGDDEFVVVSPHTRTDGLIAMARRAAEMIAAAQAPRSPLIALTAGVAACPDDGSTPEHLLSRAEEATWAAKAAGASVLSASEPPS